MYAPLVVGSIDHNLRVEGMAPCERGVREAPASLAQEIAPVLLDLPTKASSWVKGLSLEETPSVLS